MESGDYLKNKFFRMCFAAIAAIPRKGSLSLCESCGYKYENNIRKFLDPETDGKRNNIERIRETCKSIA